MFLFIYLYENCRYIVSQITQMLGQWDNVTVLEYFSMFLSKTLHMNTLVFSNKFLFYAKLVLVKELLK